MIDFSQLLSFSYYLEPNPSGDFPLGFLMLLYFGALFFIPSVLRKMATGNKYLKKSIKKGLWKFVAFGMVGVILTLARFGEVSVISMRLWLYIVFLLSVIFLIRRLWQMIRDYRKRLASVAREKNK